MTDEQLESTLTQAAKNGFDFVHVPEPYDDYERTLLNEIQAIQQAHEKQIAPLRDELVRRRASKPGRHYVMTRNTQQS